MLFPCQAIGKITASLQATIPIWRDPPALAWVLSPREYSGVAVLWGQTVGKKLFRRPGMPKAPFSDSTRSRFATSLVDHEDSASLLRNTPANERPGEGAYRWRLAEIMLLGKDAVEPFELLPLW
jgi:hypothetical protein